MINVQLICKTKISYLENCRIVIRTIDVPFGTRPSTRLFHHFDNPIFCLENPVENQIPCNMHLSYKCTIDLRIKNVIF